MPVKKTLMIIFTSLKMNRKRQLFLLAIITMLMITACVSRGTQHPVSQPQYVTRQCQIVEQVMGPTQICGQPQKIVALAPNTLEILLALNVQPVGYADYIPLHQGDYDHPSRQIPYLGERITGEIVNVGIANSPSVEALLKIQPDLIIGTENNKSQYEMLSKIAPTLLFPRFKAQDNLQKIAKLLGRSEQAEKILADNQQRLTAAQKAFSPIVKTHPQVLMLVSLGQSISEQLRFPRRDSFCDSLVTSLGFKLVSPQSLVPSNKSIPPPLSIEILPKFNSADAIILLGGNFSNLQPSHHNYFASQMKKLKQQWQENAIAQSLKASQEGRVYFLPVYLCLGLPGPIGTELYLNELQNQLLSPPGK
ncbi:iron-siderophore ABC transporter substrate-binding protein [Nostoc sp. TCL26-01]|uniref:ABC transporter substrate-binding protein n=1 Tax=Nostoc sp. TCL26-01 TaxID=2576904 RepID=UPI0015BAB747|nr:iron-siderophore ABC transporter substrate-binding protein [Nostoc sp. TCL26-01]QLE57675.1 iron-siderophore ABC transporter substrate-binding protein [Nostoc sp. TCL26-01]